MPLPLNAHAPSLCAQLKSVGNPVKLFAWDLRTCLVVSGFFQRCKIGAIMVRATQLLAWLAAVTSTVNAAAIEIVPEA